MAKAPSGPWQRLGDEFFLMVGNCITEWARVEDALFNICWRCLGGSKETAAIVYYRTPSIDVRMSLTDELVKSVLPKRARKSGGHDHSDVKLWNDIETDFRDLQQPRNQIAHHPVTVQQRRFSANDAVGTPIFESWFEIYVSQAEQLRERSTRFKPMRVDDLRAPNQRESDH
jgi:hypothetical protein